MLKNFLKIAFRNLARNKTYSAITIGGIAIGLTVFLLIVFYISDELSFDRYHQNADRIYRLVQHARWPGGGFDVPITSAPFAPGIKAEYPEVKEATRILPEGGGNVHYKDKTIVAQDIFFADNNVFNVFSFPFLYGDQATALAKPQSIVLTESLAKKLFDDPQDAINQTIYFENNYPNTITGVIKDIPNNSHIGFSALRSFASGYTDGWQNHSLFTYLLLEKDADVMQLETKLQEFAQKTIMAEMGVMDYHLEMQPLTSIHLRSDLQYDMGPRGNMDRIYIFAAIAALILIIAIINYMNLVTARSTLRLREVGIRKVVGSRKRQVMGLFVTEALVVTLLAAVVAISLFFISLPWFNELAGKQLKIGHFSVSLIAPVFVGFIIVLGLVSGSYPAVFISRFKEIPSLKGQLGNLSNSVLLRKSLVVFQFVVTIIMITASLVIFNQMKYVLNADLGFNKEQVLTFHIDGQKVREQVSTIKDRLLQSPLIKNVAAASNPIGNNDLGSRGCTFETPEGTFSGEAKWVKMVQRLEVDEDFVPTMELRVVRGRNFSPSTPSDKNDAVLVNEALMQELGWKNPIGKRVRFNDRPEEREVVGVVKDFHTYSLQHKVDPLIMSMPSEANDRDNLYVQIDTRQTAKALEYIENVYSGFDSSNPVEFYFLAENFAQQYDAEQKQEQLSLVFTLLAVLIACLGLFGLATFSVQKKIKEVGIRKVLGATVTSVAILLGKEYVRLVIIASGISVPVAWYAMNRWLEGFAYRIEVQWWMFGLAGLLAVTLAMMTISFQSVKAALTNPSKTLRTE